MKRKLCLAVCALVAFSTLAVSAEIDPNKEVVPGVKRGDTIIVEDPSAAIINPDNFNLWTAWAGGNGGVSNGLQQLAMDTLWYIDPDAGLKHGTEKDNTWHNSLASAAPIYNKDFTVMTAKLKKGIYWSDGVEFTSADVKYTVEILAQNTTALFGANFKVDVKSVETPDKYTVVFNLNAPNSRFHRNFTVRWNACWIMPKHVVEKALKTPTDFMAYTFNPPVSIGAYTLKDYDKHGTWTLWQLRDDWQRTSIADFGKPVPKYAMYMSDLPNDKKVIAQTNHDLDMIHEVTPEGMIALAKNKWETNWFQGFPFGHPDPTLVAILPNNAKAPYDNVDVRWAMALSLDMTKLALASYKGAVTMSALQYPPTGTSKKYYFDPMQKFMNDLTIDTGKNKAYKPYDTTIAKKIADMARPTFGDSVPKDAERQKAMLGQGWFKYDPKAASDLLEKNGFTKKGGKWYKPNGEQWKITLFNWSTGNPTLQRLGTMIAELWTDFGIETTALWAQDNGTNYNLGQFDVNMGWNIESWGGHPDLSYFADTLHSRFYTPIGTFHPGRNQIRYKSAELDKILDQNNKTDFNDTAACAKLGIEYLKVTAKDLPEIPLMSYNVFSSQDNTYWSGYPNFDKPYANTVTNWSNSRYIFTQLKQMLPPKK
jgi:peptide/nickel transport system substrate-binding protein